MFRVIRPPEAMAKPSEARRDRGERASELARRARAQRMCPKGTEPANHGYAGEQCLECVIFRYVRPSIGVPEGQDGRRGLRPTMQHVTRYGSGRVLAWIWEGIGVDLGEIECLGSQVFCKKMQKKCKKMQNYLHMSKKSSTFVADLGIVPVTTLLNQ